MLRLNDELSTRRGAAAHNCPIVGRTDKLRALLDAYEHATDRGCLIVPKGEPAVGKARLAERFIPELRSRGALVLAGRCYEGESGLAYGALAVVLSSGGTLDCDYGVEVNP